jgi:predicted peptidase
MRSLTFFLAIIVFGACSTEDNPKVTVPVIPSWSDGFPKVAYGATSVDVNVKTNQSAEVYYILSDRPLAYSNEELKHYAEYPDTFAIKASGKIELNANTEFTQTVTLLQENQQYYTYFVLRSKSGNALSEINEFSMATLYRQDTAFFHSIAEDRDVAYLVYQPEEVMKHPEKNYPVCFSFGDKNAVATDQKPINVVRDGSLPEYIYLLNNVPMIVISIQSQTAEWNLSMIEEGVDHVLLNYPVDENRIYMTGYGEGAIASWNYAIAHSEQIAAIVPISGKGDIPNACNLTNVDVWAFHNETDDIIASANTKKMVSAIGKCSPQKELSEIYFPDAGHNCWKRVYNQGHSDWSKSPGIDKMNIYTWLKSKSKI